MGNHYGGKAHSLLPVADLAGKALAQVGIQGRKRLVQQDKLWLSYQGAGKGNPLTFAAAATTANCDGADFLFWLSGAQAGDQYNAQDFTAVYSEEQGATLTLTLK